MKKNVFYIALTCILVTGKVSGQNQSSATLVFHNRTELFGTINIVPGKAFNCNISFTQKSTVTEKSKGQRKKTTTSYETSFNTSAINYMIINFTEYYPKSVYDKVNKTTTCYLTQRIYRKGNDALYLLKNDKNVTSYFFEGGIDGSLRNIEDSVFTGETSNEELANLFLRCSAFSKKFRDKETGYLLISSMTLEQKLDAFKKWVDEYNNCPK